MAGARPMTAQLPATAASGNEPWMAQQMARLAGRRGHAWLLAGPSGLGQYELALGLASAWLCDHAGPQGACGTCPSCHAISVRTHADLRVLMPETALLALGWPLGEKAQQEIDARDRKPSREIRVEALRETIEFCQRSSARGQGKVVLVYPAERMNTVSANALLKTLEEPAGDVRFLLASEAAHLLAPTVRSRCQLHTMDWPGPEMALAWLRQQGLSDHDASVLLRASGGRPQEAMRYAREGRGAALWQGLPAAVSRGDLAAFKDWTSPQLLDALYKLSHDMVLRACGAPPRFFLPGELPAPASLRALSDWSRELTRAMRSAEHPFQIGLMQEALLGQARQALSRRDASPGSATGPAAHAARPAAPVS
ncbi:MAG: DNA polymerase III subunit delta' [Rhodoferax sp.]|nr:DNA polymerase III subunit delta' [Rhodoferax sp.]